MYHLKLNQLIRDQLLNSIATAKSDIAKLNDQQQISDIEASIAETTQERNQLVSQLNEQLAQLQEQEKVYSDLRLETVELYRKASQGFKTASQSASAKGRDYINTFQNVSDTELLNVWQNDRQHNETAAQLLELLVHIPEVKETATKLKQLFTDQAGQAGASAEENETALTEK